MKAISFVIKVTRGFHEAAGEAAMKFVQGQKLLARLQSLFGPSAFPMMHCTRDCQQCIFNMFVTMPQVLITLWQ